MPTEHTPGKRSLLLLHKRLRLEEGRLLGQRKQALRERDDVLHLGDIVDAVLDGLGVVGTCGIEDTLDAGDLRVGPVAVRLADGLQRISE